MPLMADKRDSEVLTFCPSHLLTFSLSHPPHLLTIIHNSKNEYFNHNMMLSLHRILKFGTLI